ncbi:LodA/GoxA family CTQ-dependent oxidase [Streptomyces bobili]|uniref:LodA/GoxA family CTQ-dependent oxidase n=1 Tax=Streptomyces bobili TaxID=67280 RepID=UPI00372414AB
MRNALVWPRSRLVIDPRSRSVRGHDRAGRVPVRHRHVPRHPRLPGELRTDRAGRLLFLGGRGKAASADNLAATDFANNDGWHDDIADGPVRAEVRIEGRAIPVEPAWVVVASPDYAPGLKSVRTLYDLLRDTYVKAGLLPRPQLVSFTQDVLPVLRRLCDLQWANHGLAVQFGHGGRDHLLAPERLARLASKDSAHKELRRQVWASLRHLDRDGMSTVPWPSV